MPVRRSRNVSSELLARDGRQRCGRRRIEAMTLTRRALHRCRSARTKASSSVACPLLRDQLLPPCPARRRGLRRGSRCGRTAPRLPASRATRTAGICLRRAARRSCSRNARTLMMSRPFVGSSSRIVSRIVDERAGDRHLHLLALRETLRAAVGERRQAERARSVRRCARRVAAPGEAVQRAVSSGCFRAR